MQKIISYFHKRVIALAIILIFTLGFGIGVLAQEGAGSVYLPVIAGSANQSTNDTPSADDPVQQAINILAAHPEFVLHLANYPGWRGEAELDGDQEDVYYVWFYDDANDEWLGDGTVNVATNEVLDFYAPREKTPEEFQEGLAKIEAFLTTDGEILARQENPDLWYHEVYYDRWDKNWGAYYSYGIDEFNVTMYIDGDDVYLDAIVDPNIFEAAEALSLARDQAIELAYQAENIDQALEGFDDWRAYAEHQGDGRWTVEFVSDGQEIFHALVDIDTEQVIESGS